MSFFLFKYFHNQRLIRQQIEEIVERNFNGYRGYKWCGLKKVHTTLRRQIGNKKFLKFLRETTEANPLPKYKPTTNE